MDAIVAKDLVKRYISYEKQGFFKRRKIVVEALKGISFNIREGEVFGLLGPNGAGKTTTVKILSTLLLPDSGTAKVLSYDVVAQPEKVREVIGVTLSVEKGFFWKLTGRENLKYFGMLKGLKGKELESRINEVMRVVGLNKLHAENKLYEEYSLGMKARLSLARALLTDPPVLILDEPTLGLDPASARTIRELLVRLAKDKGKTVLITTHNMFEAEIICDRVAIINSGKIVAIGTIKELKRRVADKVALEFKISNHMDINSVKEFIARKLNNMNVYVNTINKGIIKIRVLVDSGDEESYISKVLEILHDQGLRVYQVMVQEPSLEDVFIALTRGGTS